MNIWRIVFVVFCMDLIQLQSAAESFGDVNYDLRKLVAENHKMIRSLTENLSIQSRRVTTLEEKLSKSEEEKLILVQKMESLESRVLDCGLKQNGEETPAQTLLIVILKVSTVQKSRKRIFVEVRFIIRHKQNYNYRIIKLLARPIIYNFFLFLFFFTFFLILE